MTIRLAAADDVSAIARLTGELGYSGSESEFAGRLARMLAADDHTVLVAVDPDGCVIGWIHVFLALHVQSPRCAEVGGMVVAEGHRGAGVGSRLLAAAEDWGATAGVESMCVRSRVERDAAHAFYTRRGYAVTKEQRVYDKPIAAIKPGRRGPTNA